MSYTYLLESGEESSAECYSDIPAFARLKSSRSVEKFSSKDNATESSQNSQSGTTCEHSTGDRGAGKSIAFAEASLAKTFPQRAKARESTGREAGYGVSSRVLLAKFDHATRSWKTLQCSFLGGSDECLETLPRWGMTQGGSLWELTMSEPRTGANASGYWRTPTPLASDGSPQQAMSKVCHLRKSNFGVRVSSVPYWILKNYNMRFTPTMSEWLMGYPISWTDLKPLATDKFRSWRQQLLTF